jgi:hypothetical protein
MGIHEQDTQGGTDVVIFRGLCTDFAKDLSFLVLHRLHPPESQDSHDTCGGDLLDDYLFPASRSRPAISTAQR